MDLFGETSLTPLMLVLSDWTENTDPLPIIPPSQSTPGS